MTDDMRAAPPPVQAVAPKKRLRPHEELPGALKTRAAEELPLATHSLSAPKR